MNSRNLTNLSSFVFVEKVNDDTISVNLAVVLVRDDRVVVDVVGNDVDDDDDDNDDDNNDCIPTNCLVRVSSKLYSTSQR
tara:strand:- start:40 stop:279 length:240 start_codon:yes stop_codon:yes gene_type:complete